jgi:hypothetical protein
MRKQLRCLFWWCWFCLESFVLFKLLDSWCWCVHYNSGPNQFDVVWCSLSWHVRMCPTRTRWQLRGVPICVCCWLSSTPCARVPTWQSRPTSHICAVTDVKSIKQTNKQNRYSSNRWQLRGDPLFLCPRWSFAGVSPRRPSRKYIHVQSFVPTDKLVQRTLRSHTQCVWVYSAIRTVDELRQRPAVKRFALFTNKHKPFMNV